MHGTRCKRRSLSIALLTGCLALLPGGRGRAQDVPPRAAPRPEAPGRLVNLGGYRLHLQCTGRGSPTVVLSSGAGDFSFDWALVQPEVAKLTRVCAYDRAGEAWSEPGPRPGTVDQEVFDLHRLLARAGERAPYILVGQSLGGLVGRLFAAAYPRETAGLVLVDAFSEDAQLGMNGKLVRIREAAQARSVPLPHDRLRPDDRPTAQELQEAEKFVKEVVGAPRIGSPYDRLPAQAQAWRLWALAQPTHYLGGDAYLAEIAARVYARTQATPAPLGDLPLVVLARTRHDYPPDVRDMLAREHDEQQRRMASLSRKGVLVVVPDAGHHIQLDQPGAVVDAIRSLVLARRRAP